MENELKYSGLPLSIKYVPGDGTAFVTFIQNLKDRARLIAIDEKFRWVVTEEDGTQVIYRPEETKPND